MGRRLGAVAAVDCRSSQVAPGQQVSVGSSSTAAGAHSPRLSTLPAARQQQGSSGPFSRLFHVLSRCYSLYIISQCLSRATTSRLASSRALRACLWVPAPPAPGSAAPASTCLLRNRVHGRCKYHPLKGKRGASLRNGSAREVTQTQWARTPCQKQRISCASLIHVASHHGGSGNARIEQCRPNHGASGPAGQLCNAGPPPAQGDLLRNAARWRRAASC